MLNLRMMRIRSNAVQWEVSAERSSEEDRIKWRKSREQLAKRGSSGKMAVKMVCILLIVLWLYSGNCHYLNRSIRTKDTEFEVLKPTNTLKRCSSASYRRIYKLSGVMKTFWITWHMQCWTVVIKAKCRQIQWFAAMVVWLNSWNSEVSRHYAAVITMLCTLRLLFVYLFK